MKNREIRTVLMVYGMLFFGWGVALPVLADEADTLNVSISVVRAHDDNLFRLRDRLLPVQVAPGAVDRGDTIQSERLALSFDKSYSLQRLHLAADVTRNDFTQFSFLNHVSRHADAYWDWSLTPDLTGRLATDYTRTLNNFVDYRDFARNLRTMQNQSASLDWAAFQSWHVVAQARRSRVQDTHVLPTGNTAMDSGEGGIRYVSADGDSLTLLGRHARISWRDMPRDTLLQYDTSAIQRDGEVQVDVRAGGKSRIQAVLSHISRQHAYFPARDFSGLAGNVQVVWTPTGKTQVQFSASRNLDDWWDIHSSYNLTRTLAIMPSVQITPELSFRVRLERSRRHFYGAILPLAGLPMRQDTIRGFQASLNWNPWRSLSVDLSLQREHRTSNQADLDYTDNTSLLKTQWSF